MIATSVVDLIKAALILASKWLEYSIAKMKVENYREDIKDDEYIQNESDLANSDIANAPAHIRNAQLRQQQKIGRHKLQQISPL